jgi:hypothetical protein
MGSKKYKDKPCAYCALELSSTADHVFCREFFPVGFREGLPKAPACKRCNERKSALESYLTTILPFGSSHPAALSGQMEKVARRLAKQPSTKQRIDREAEVVWVETPQGIIVPTVGLPLDPDKVVEYFDLTVRGLVWHEWAAVVPDDYAVEVFTLAPEAFEAFSATILSLGKSTKVRRSFAKGALQYVAARAPKDPAFSTWHITLYEGLGLANAEHSEGRLQVVVVCGPAEIREVLQRLRDGDA